MKKLFFVGNYLYLKIDNFGDYIEQEAKYIRASSHGIVFPLKIYTEKELKLEYGKNLKCAKDLEEYIELYNKS